MSDPGTPDALGYNRGVLRAARPVPNVSAPLRRTGTRSWRIDVLAAGLISLVSLPGGGCAPASESRLDADGFPLALEPYSVQMHIHGHSHHNGDPRPGSMQWHSHFAAENELDVLWWSDHSEMFDLRYPLAMHFDRRPREAARTRARDPRELRQGGHLGADGVSLELVRAAEGDLEWVRAQGRWGSDRLRLAARSRPGEEAFATSVYSVRGPKGAPRGFLLPRPVSSGALLSVELDTSELGPNARLELGVVLSWHHRGQARRHELRYIVAPVAAEPARRAVGGRAVVVTVPVGAGRNKLLLDLERDAELLPDGADNSITGINVRLSSRRGASAVVDLFGLELSSRNPEPDHQLAQLRRFAGLYAAEYGHAQNVGVEFLVDDEDFTHMNAFLPAGALTGELAAGDESTWKDPAEFVRRVSELRGVTSFNHLFGPATGRGRPRVERRRSRARALDLLNNGAYGADILEVGYVARGGVGLEYHLRTWDLLTARGLFLYGNGVSDAHGSEWGPRMKPNHFATWIWSEGRAPEQLLAAVKKGRMVFGDPFSTSGRLFFTVGDARMGDRVPVRPEPLELRVAADESLASPDHRVYLIQGLIRPAEEEIAYVTGHADGDYRREIDLAEKPTIDASRPCFVRLEVYGKAGQPLLFTNPVVFRETP